jgi:hypothetical protein
MRLTALPALTLGFLLSTPPVSSFADAPASAKLILEDDFDRKELGPGWKVQFGDFSLKDGALHAAQKPSDNHAAAGRRALETGDAIYTFRFQLGKESEGLHFGFDPVRGALDKKGHLFSIIITPKQWKIMKHVDKNRPKEDPNEVLAQENKPFLSDTWYTLQVTTRGKNVKAIVDDEKSLSASHPTFSVRKPTLVFRAIGSGIVLDDLTVRSLDLTD